MDHGVLCVCRYNDENTFDKCVETIADINY